MIIVIFDFLFVIKNKVFKYQSIMQENESSQRFICGITQMTEEGTTQLAFTSNWSRILAANISISV